MLSDLLNLFPNLATDGYNRTSLPTISYNCVAWAFGDQTKWWEPDPFGMFSWPCPDRQYTIQSYEALAKSQGYNRCADHNLESGYEKIAIFALGQQPTHIARQLDTGKWTSKLGDLDDITHALQGVEGARYGKSVRIMKRPKS